MSTIETLPLPCTAPPCQSYAPGHRVHFIQARLAGESPWGWRDAVVSRIEGRWTLLSYLDLDTTASLWHHQDLAGILQPGAPVRLHERYHLLGSPSGWFSVFVRDGAGSVPEPTDTGPWRPLMTGAVVDNRAGRALPLDHRTGSGHEPTEL